MGVTVTQMSSDQRMMAAIWTDNGLKAINTVYIEIFYSDSIVDVGLESAFTVEDEPQPVGTSNRGDEQENADYSTDSWLQMEKTRIYTSLACCYVAMTLKKCLANLQFVWRAVTIWLKVLLGKYNLD